MLRPLVRPPLSSPRAAPAIRSLGGTSNIPNLTLPYLTPPPPPPVCAARSLAGSSGSPSLCCAPSAPRRAPYVWRRAVRQRRAAALPRSEKGVRLVQRLQVGPCIPVGMELYRAEVGPTFGPNLASFSLGQRAGRDLSRARPVRIARCMVSHIYVGVAY
jgi:hypothetical protein